MKKILIIHNNYRNIGGEDIAVKNEISYLKNLGNFKLKIDTDYSLFSKIPDYGANLEISGTF